MKTLVAAVTLFLSASAAMAEAPCQNPVSPPCQKACATMGAKLVLSMREQSLAAAARVRPVRSDDSLYGDRPAAAQQLAGVAGLSLDYIDGLPLLQIRNAIKAYCPR